MKKKSFKDLFWSLSDNLSQQIMNFVVGIILARLLLPQDFGLVGIITVFLTISNVLVDGGFSSALIHKKDLKNIDYNTVFYTNVFISTLIYILLFIGSETIASFFKRPELKGMIRIAGLNIVLLSFSAIHRTIIIRNLNFKLITLVSFIAVFISATSAIYLAYSGFGVYSLIYRVLIGEIATILLFWILNKWRPKLEFSFESLKGLFSYGSNLLFSNILNSLHSNLFYFIIGKFYSPAQLGYYTRASTFRDLASSNISNTIKRVSFSTLSKINDHDKMVDEYLFFRNITYLCSSSCMLILFACSEEIIVILLSEKWLSSVWILKSISSVGIFLTLYNIGLNFFAVIGNTKLLLKVEIFGKFLIIPIVIISLFTSFNTFITLIIIHTVIMYLIILELLRRMDKKIFSIDILNVSKFLFILLISWILFNYLLSPFGNVYINLVVKSIIVLTLVVLTNIKVLKTIK